METVKANLTLNGSNIPFLIAAEDEVFFRDASKILNDRLIVLLNKYGQFASTETLISTIAIEAMADALKAQDNYERLQEELNSKLDQLNHRLRE